MSSQPRPLFVGSGVYSRSAFPNLHPLSFSRVGAVEAICREMGWLDGLYVNAVAATRDELARFHTPAYIDAFARADREGHVSAEARAQFGLGTMANPIFPGVFARAATSVGGSILAARLAAQGRIVFHPAGGTHHGRAGRAAGFCYFNDPVFAILESLALGAARVAYVDFDAHHGDGVEDAFADDKRVRTISLHEQGRWPGSGANGDRRAGQARNLCVPSGLNDTEFEFLVSRAVVPLVRDFAPEALVIVAGADALAGDPLARLALGNGALWRGVAAAAACAARVVVLGGGGYNPWNVARGWSGLWARLAGFAIPDLAPPSVRKILEGLDSDLIDEDDRAAEWTTSFADAPRPGAVRAEVREIAARALAP
ncbi:MAG: acetoin utilization protein AcuC [Pseudomonadota bacterium]|nr:acetoin utilization protein AcuC [Pseudomonadota bacterium]